MNFQSRKMVDVWLNKLCLFRKNIAVDETSFFRSISDQIFATQSHHEKLRKMFIEHVILVNKWFTSKEELQSYIGKLRNHVGVYGEFEMTIIADIVKCDFILYDPSTFTVKSITQFGYLKKVRLCLMKHNHYDSVFEKSHIDNMAFCQSIVYKILFEDVFGLDKVEDISGKMLNKTFTDDTTSTGPGAPFAYRVAKAVNPAIYRNVEFDVWHQERRAIRNRDWYAGGDDFVVGTQCLVEIHGEKTQCYVQKICSDENGTTYYKVYVIKLAQQKEVTRQELYPLPNAKPWTAPYMKNKDSNIEELATLNRNKNGAYKNPEDYVGCSLYPALVNYDDQEYDDNYANMNVPESAISASSVNSYGDTTISKFLYAKFGEFGIADYQRNVVCARGETHFGSTGNDGEQPPEPTHPEYPAPPEQMYEMSAEDLARPTPPVNVTSPNLSEILASLNRMRQIGEDIVQQSQEANALAAMEVAQPMLYSNHAVWVNIPVLLNAQYCMQPGCDEHSAQSTCFGNVTTFPPHCMSYTSYPAAYPQDDVLDLRINSEEYDPEEGLPEANDNTGAAHTSPPISATSPTGNTYDYSIPPPYPIRPIPVRPLYPTYGQHNAPPFYNPLQPAPYTVNNYPQPCFPPPMYYPNNPQYPCVQHPFGPYVVPPPPVGVRPYGPNGNTYQNPQENRQNPTTADASNSSRPISPLPPTPSPSGMYNVPYTTTINNPLPPGPLISLPYGHGPVQPLRPPNPIPPYTQPPPPKNNPKTYPPTPNNNNNNTSKPSNTKNPNVKPQHYQSSSSTNFNSSNTNTPSGSVSNQWFGGPSDNLHRKHFVPRFNNNQTNMMPPRYQYDGRPSGRPRGGYMGWNNGRFRRYAPRPQFSPPSPVLEEPVTTRAPTIAPSENKQERTKQDDATVRSTRPDFPSTSSERTLIIDLPIPDAQIESTIEFPILDVGTETTHVTAQATDGSLPDSSSVDNAVASSNVDSIAPTTVPVVSAASTDTASENRRDNNNRENNGQSSRGARKKKYFNKGGNNNNHND